MYEAVGDEVIRRRATNEAKQARQQIALNCPIQPVHARRGVAADFVVL
jgi:hypothetical protein